MPYRPSEEWMVPAAAIMVREGVGLTEALTKLNVPLSSKEAGAFSRSKGFQTVLRQETNRYFGEIGSDPTYAKSVVIGQLIHCARQLMNSGEYDKGAEVLLKLSKVAGWLSPDTNVNVFAGLSGKEMEDVRRRLLERANESSSTGTVERLPN